MAIRALLICCVVMCVVGVASAQQAFSPRSQGMGNANASALGGSEAIFLNPAALPWLSRSADSTDNKLWGGQALGAFSFANATGVMAPDTQSECLLGAGASNGKHGLGIYFADLDLVLDNVQEVGIGYGYAFNREWAFGGMLRLLDRPGDDNHSDVQVTAFSVQRNWWQPSGKPITATVTVNDPYDHTDTGMIIDLGGSCYFSDNFLFTAWVTDVAATVHRLLNVGAELEVRPGWFVRTGFEEKPGKTQQGISLGVGHRVQDWQFDVALTSWEVRVADMNLDLAVTGGATIFF